MNSMTIDNVWTEKGWGMFFDVVDGEHRHRFSVSLETLGAPGLQDRTKRTFPEIFESSRSIMLRAANYLIRTGQLDLGFDIGGTEIRQAHVREVLGNA
jgi:hypothetical protein